MLFEEVQRLRRKGCWSIAMWGRAASASLMSVRSGRKKIMGSVSTVRTGCFACVLQLS